VFSLLLQPSPLFPALSSRQGKRHDHKDQACQRNVRSFGRGVGPSTSVEVPAEEGQQQQRCTARVFSHYFQDGGEIVHSLIVQAAEA
jgi:hypothetical protein